MEVKARILVIVFVSGCGGIAIIEPDGGSVDATVDAADAARDGARDAPGSMPCTTNSECFGHSLCVSNICCAGWSVVDGVCMCGATVGGCFIGDACCFNADAGGPACQPSGCALH